MLDKEMKKQIGIMAFVMVAGISWYLADLIPTLALSGRSIVLLVMITGAAIHFLEYLIERLTGATKEDVPEIISIDNTTDPEIARLLEEVTRDAT